MSCRKNIGTEVTSSDGIASSKLNSGPPFGIEQNLVRQPVRNELLAGGGMAELANLDREGVLGTASNSDSGLKRSNVRFIHGDEAYTRNLVTVNKISCFEQNKGSCTVLPMKTLKKASRLVSTKTAKPKEGRVRKPDIGPDGYTLSQRLSKLMIERDIGQARLAQMCSEFYAAFVPATEDKVKQQHIFNLINKDQSSSWCLPLIAQVLDASDLWLSLGIGQKERR